MGSRRRSTLLVIVATTLAAACSSTGGGATDVGVSDPATLPVVPADSEPSTDLFTSGTTADGDPADTVITDTDITGSEPIDSGPVGSAVGRPWTQIVPDAEGCVCSDGSEFSFFERAGDPTKVMFYFEGGGACFSLATCDPDGDPDYSIGIRQTTDSLEQRGGFFDETNEANPLADHSIVYVPYCTGDAHLGDTTTAYSDDVVIEHRGAVNARAALDHLVEQYPDAEQVLVTGASAGSVPTPLAAGLVADRLPDAEIITLGDSSGAYPDEPAVNEMLADVWGTTNAIPDWPENEGLAGADWSFPDLYIQAGVHDPDITFARFDHAFDGVQASFIALTGIDPDAVDEQIDATEDQIEAAGIPLAVYVAPGAAHTMVGGDRFYTLEVDGVRLIDWITELVAGEVPADVHCTDCQA